MFNRVEKKAVSLYRSQWEIIEEIAQEHAEKTGDRPNISMALRRIITEYARRRQQPRTLVDEGVGYSVGEPATEEA